MSVFTHKPTVKFPTNFPPVTFGRLVTKAPGSSRPEQHRDRPASFRNGYNSFTSVKLSDSVLSPSDRPHRVHPRVLSTLTAIHRSQSTNSPNYSDDCSSSVRSSTISRPVALTVISPLLTTSDLVFTQPLQIAFSLSKARLSLLVVSTAAVGCALAASTSMASTFFLAHPIRSILCLALGTGLTSCAANTVNQIMEIPFDSQMTRTQNRVLVRGLATPGQAGLFAVTCAVLGLTTLYLALNPLVTSLAACNVLMYTTLYTPLKQMSQSNTWIGALVGSVPPLMGWAAATGEIESGSLILAGLLYVWQFPHFMALSWNLRHEYSKAGHMMTSVLEPDVCKGVALRYAVASSLVCLAGAGCSAISLGPWAGCALGIACLPPNVGLIYYAWKFSQSACSNGGSAAAAARRLFKATLFHLPVVMTAALIGTYGCMTGLA